MELTPEEKNRIYAEEKARIEALAKIKEEKKLETVKAGAKTLHGCLMIIAFIAAVWILYYPTKVGLSYIFLSNNVIEKVAEVDQMNKGIDRDKGALWDIGMKSESSNIHYLSYPAEYDNVRTFSFIGSLCLSALGWWFVSWSAKRKLKSENKGEQRSKGVTT